MLYSWTAALKQEGIFFHNLLKEVADLLAPSVDVVPRSTKSLMGLVSLLGSRSAGQVKPMTIHSGSRDKKLRQEAQSQRDVAAGPWHPWSGQRNALPRLHDSFKCSVNATDTSN